MFTFTLAKLRSNITDLETVTSTTDRQMFVTLTRENFFGGSNDEARQFNEQTQKRIAKILADQQDESYLKEHAMPKVCKGMDYTPPVVAKHPIGARHENNFVITNNAHVKQTNNGYKRSDGGAFYCH